MESPREKIPHCDESKIIIITWRKVITNPVGKENNNQVKKGKSKKENFAIAMRSKSPTTTCLTSLIFRLTDWEKNNKPTKYVTKTGDPRTGRGARIKKKKESEKKEKHYFPVRQRRAFRG